MCFSQGVILVYDITNRWSFDGIDRWIKEIDEVKYSCTSAFVCLSEKKKKNSDIIFLCCNMYMIMGMITYIERLPTFVCLHVAKI